MFTNFSQDHLDYHSTLYAYWRAKWTLFTDYMVTHAPCYALIHNSIPISLADQERIAPNVSVIRYGHYSQSIPGAHNATYRIVDTSAQGQMVEFHVMDQTWLSWVPLLGVFQISNVLGALIAFACSGGNLATVIPALSHLKPLLGRMEYICTYNGAHIYVDYAHTPQGLTLALQALRPCTKGKLGVVFGCGGDRDGSKRPLMGNVAAMYSDWAIVTDDNPRSEDPAMIRQHVLVGCPRAQSISPRQEALRQAMACLEPGDCLLIAGKGHETTQIIGSHVLPYSDQECVRRYGNITQ
jgi:UDP-N-acetylmuramoyl-L-alanyl-D-glutamate--2,6-diaminopimelate ligase